MKKYISFYNKLGQLETLGQLEINGKQLTFHFNENSKKFFHGNFEHDEYRSGISYNSQQIINNLKDIYNIDFDININDKLSIFDQINGKNAKAEQMFFAHDNKEHNQGYIFKGENRVVDLSKKSTWKNLEEQEQIIVMDGDTGQHFDVKTVNKDCPDEIEQLYLTYLINNELNREFGGLKVHYIQQDGFDALLLERKDKPSFKMKKYNYEGTNGYLCDKSIKYGNIRMNPSQLFKYITARDIPDNYKDKISIATNAIQAQYYQSLEKIYDNIDYSKTVEENSEKITKTYIGNIMTGNLSNCANSLKFELESNDKMEEHFDINVYSLINSGIISKNNPILDNLYNAFKKRTLSNMTISDIFASDKESKIQLSKKGSGDIVARCKKVQKKIISKAKKDYDKGLIDVNLLEKVDNFFNTHIEDMKYKMEQKEVKRNLHQQKMAQ